MRSSLLPATSTPRLITTLRRHQDPVEFTSPVHVPGTFKQPVSSMQCAVGPLSPQIFRILTHSIMDVALGVCPYRLLQASCTHTRLIRAHAGFCRSHSRKVRHEKFRNKGQWARQVRVRSRRSHPLGEEQISQ